LSGEGRGDFRVGGRASAGQGSSFPSTALFHLDPTRTNPEPRDLLANPGPLGFPCHGTLPFPPRWPSGPHPSSLFLVALAQGSRLRKVPDRPFPAGSRAIAPGSGRAALGWGSPGWRAVVPPPATPFRSSVAHPPAESGTLRSFLSLVPGSPSESRCATVDSCPPWAVWMKFDPFRKIQFSGTVVEFVAGPIPPPPFRSFPPCFLCTGTTSAP
jgi:hypothetical protein